MFIIIFFIEVNFILVHLVKDFARNIQVAIFKLKTCGKKSTVNQDTSSDEVVQKKKGGGTNKEQA